MEYGQNVGMVNLKQTQKVWLAVVVYQLVDLSKPNVYMVNIPFKL